MVAAKQNILKLHLNSLTDSELWIFSCFSISTSNTKWSSNNWSWCC